MLSTVAPIAIMAAMVVMAPLLTRGMAASAFGMEISSSAAPSYLCIGLNTEGEGQVQGFALQVGDVGENDTLPQGDGGVDSAGINESFHK